MIKEAAILKDGVIYTGRRHNIILCDKSRPFQFLQNGIQGFVNDKGEFLDRKEASKHAFECGQIKKDTGRLYSEDLY